MSGLIRGSRPAPDPAKETPDVYAARAARAYAAMQGRFRTRDGLYRRDGRLHRPGTAAHLWPFSRALVATLDLAGIGDDLSGDFDADAAIAARLEALERYWDPSGDPPAYSSDVRGSASRRRRYYDDNAWVGLALVQLERMRPGSGYLERAEELFRFAASGWDRRAVPNPGGVFWVEQGRGAGATNHDRNTVSNAPNAELGLHLAELKAGPRRRARSAPREMYEWVLATLDASRESDLPAPGCSGTRSGATARSTRRCGATTRAAWSARTCCSRAAARDARRRCTSAAPRRSPARRWRNLAGRRVRAPAGRVQRDLLPQPSAAPRGHGRRRAACRDHRGDSPLHRLRVVRDAEIVAISSTSQTAA